MKKFKNLRAWFRKKLGYVYGVAIRSNTVFQYRYQGYAHTGSCLKPLSNEYENSCSNHVVPILFEHVFYLENTSNNARFVCMMYMENSCSPE